jgi:uncharacterized sulfatase
MSTGAQRPNILFIMTDEQRFDALGSVNPVVQTPNLDKLASQSIFFTRAYTTNPSCVPARAAMFTGRYPSQCGAPAFITYVNDTETTFMSLLQADGYHTAVVGKQHFGNTGIRRGYDYEDINDLHAASGLAKANDSSPSYLRYLREAGFTDQKQLVRKKTRYTSEWVADVKYHLDYYIGERGKDWLLNKRPEDKPWFLCLSFPGPHQPFDCLNIPQAAQYRLEDIDMPQTQVANLEQKPPHYKAKGEDGEILTDEEIRLMRLAYYANVTLIDEKIGEVIQTLMDVGEFDNTLIVFTSDHGDFQGDFGLAYKGQYLSEVLMRVPFILKPPVAGFRGHEEDSFVLNFDIAATSLGTAGLDIPPNMSANDLGGYWRNPSGNTVREFAYLEASDLRGIRNDRWKMIHYRNRPYGELYDLEQDPWERMNLWDEAAMIGIKQQLYSLMTNQLIELGEKSHSVWNVNAPEI